MIFELYNADGTLQLDLNSLSARILGQRTVDLNAGSITHPGFSTGRGWFYLVPLSETKRDFMPNVTASGSGASFTISWLARTSGIPCIVVYGVY